VRLGIAASSFRLGRLDAARAAFARALQLNPSCVPALAGLAVLALHAPPSANVSTCFLQKWMCPSTSVSELQHGGLAVLALHALPPAHVSRMSCSTMFAGLDISSQ